MSPILTVGSMEKIPLLISRLARLCRRGEDFDTLVKAYGLTKEEQDLLRMVLYTGSDMKRNK